MPALNRQPTRWKRVALPIELKPHYLMGFGPRPMVVNSPSQCKGLMYIIPQNCGVVFLIGRMARLAVWSIGMLMVFLRCGPTMCRACDYYRRCGPDLYVSILLFVLPLGDLLDISAYLRDGAPGVGRGQGLIQDDVDCLNYPHGARLFHRLSARFSSLRIS